MGRVLYTVLIIILGLSLGFLLLLVSGGYIFEGEAAMGIGILSWFSLPAVLVIGLLLGRYTYAWYSSLNALATQAAGLLGLAVAVAVLSPTITYTTLWLVSLIRTAG